MQVKKKLALSLAALALSASALVLASPAGAGHLRPKGATPLRDSLVVAQKQCQATNNTHNSPPTVSSCTPPGGLPAQESSWVTAGTPDVNGVGSNFIGNVNLLALSNDVQIRMQVSDVRCLPPTAAGVCSVPNAGAGPDYTGQLQLQVGLRVTDHRNGMSLNQTGTIIDFPFQAAVPCQSSAQTNFGSLCPLVTTFNTVVPGMVLSNQRMSFEIPQGSQFGGIQVFDGGQTGTAGSTGATLFAETGVFVP